MKYKGFEIIRVKNCGFTGYMAPGLPGYETDMADTINAVKGWINAYLWDCYIGQALKIVAPQGV